MGIRGIETSKLSNVNSLPEKIWLKVLLTTTLARVFVLTFFLSSSNQRVLFWQTM